MLRLTYLLAVGGSIGAVAGAACGHPPFWVTIGLGLGLLWRRATPRDAGSGPGQAVAPEFHFFWKLFFLVTMRRLRRIAIETRAPASPAAAAGIAVLPTFPAALYRPSSLRLGWPG